MFGRNVLSSLTSGTRKAAPSGSLISRHRTNSGETDGAGSDGSADDSVAEHFRGVEISMDCLDLCFCNWRGYVDG